MVKARDILRLKYDVGLSLREIGKACNCGKSTVSEVIERAEKAGITWPIYLNDKQFMSFLYPPAEIKSTMAEPDMDYTFNEMRKKSVTLMLLWEEYKHQNPDGIMYTQFCDRYNKFKKNNNLTMHKEHKAGEEVEVDWAGQTIPYVNIDTGEVLAAYIFVSVLPASHYPFVYAYENMKLPNWIDAHTRMFEYYGGVPRVIIPDNTKTAVTKTDRIDPVLNKTYNEMAQHYRITILPARPIKPKDKGSDENMVGNVSRRVLAALRNRQFFSVQEVNRAIAEELEKFIRRPFQKREGNRLTAFQMVDKPQLRVLPPNRYEYSEWKEAKIQYNYHVEYDSFFYSVDYSYAGQSCSVRATSKVIEIFIGTHRIASYVRNFKQYNRYTTRPEHMPDNHKVVAGWSADRFLSWADKVGPMTRQYINSVLESRDHPVQTYRACMGIMQQAKNSSNEMMEIACKEAYERKEYSFKYFNIILKTTAARSSATLTEKAIVHSNIRGSEAFKGGGLHA